MQLIDIGANLTHESFDHDRDAVLQRARAAGVAQMVLTGTSLAVEPYADLEAVAHALDLSMISHGPARFDPAELRRLDMLWLSAARMGLAATA